MGTPFAAGAFLLGIAPLLSGCLPAPRDPNRLLAPAASIRASCGSAATHLAQERCARSRIIALYEADGAPTDVLMAYVARREAIAEKMDSGAITEAEGRAEMAEASVAANAQARQRRPPGVVCTSTPGLTVCR